MNETSLKRGNVRGELKAERNVLEKVINGSFVKLIVGIRRERERERGYMWDCAFLLWELNGMEIVMVV